MIAFGIAVTDPGTYERCAAPGIRLAAEPDSEVLAHQGTGSLFRNYNLLLDMAAPREDLEALVLVHQDAEIVDPDFCQKLRQALEDPMIALVGCVGAVGVRSIAWWEGAVTWASFSHRYLEEGGGEFPAFAWDRDELPPYARTGEVDAIDGFVMAVSPWAVRELRFDESLGTKHGYDLDFCLQARAGGRKVVTTDFRVVHHHSLELVSDPEPWIQAHVKVAEKWDSRMAGGGAAGRDWKQRARRAEAEAAVLRTHAVSVDLQGQARAKALEAEVGRLRENIEGIEKSVSWRITAPLRWLKGVARRRP